MASDMAGSIHAAAEFIDDRIVARYATLASATLLIWDTLLTMDQQISRVWFTKPSFGRTLFIVNRYLPIVLIIYQIIYQFYTSPPIEFSDLNPSCGYFSVKFSDANSPPTSCKSGFLISGLGGVVNFWTIQSVLITRMYALYQNRCLVAALLVLSLGSTATMATILIYLFTRFMTYLPTGSLPIPGCTPLCGDPLCIILMRIFPVPFFVLETVILLLTVYKTLKTFRTTGWRHLSHLSRIVYRDGLVYYLVIVLMAAVNVILWLAAPSNLGDLGQCILLSLQSTICSRLFLNIREIIALGPSSIDVLRGAAESHQQRYMSLGGESSELGVGTQEIEMILQELK